MSLILFVFADIDICYFMQAYSEPVMLEEHKIQVVGEPPLRPQVHVCLAFFEKIIFRPCSICFIFFFLSDVDICYFMHASSKVAVLEEHQIDVVGDPHLPPPLPRYVYVSLSFNYAFNDSMCTFLIN